MRAISVFRLEAGTSTFCCRALIALRMRASMSATGSVNFIRFASPCPLSWVSHLFACPVLNFAHFASLGRGLSSPGRLRNAGYLPAQRQPAEAQPADTKLAQI